MLVSDLDGTLLDNNSLVTPMVKAAIAEAETRGVRVVLSSGRCFVTMRQYEEALNLHTPGHYSIAFNGGYIYETDTHKPIFDRRLRPELSKEIICAIKSQKANLIVYVGSKLYYERLDESVNTYGRVTKMPLTPIDDFCEIEEEISKILITGDHEDLLAIYDNLKDFALGRCNTFFSSARLLEYCPLEAHKGLGVEFLCRYLDIDPGEVIAVGDYDNDISMIIRAGLGIAVQNAVSAVRDAADIITNSTNNDGAIREVIEKYLK
jgi:Cof subfamily protein (haloacid dehalogenase superfamily)